MPQEAGLTQSFRDQGCGKAAALSYFQELAFVHSGKEWAGWLSETLLLGTPPLCPLNSEMTQSENVAQLSLRKQGNIQQSLFEKSLRHDVAGAALSQHLLLRVERVFSAEQRLCLCAHQQLLAGYLQNT